MELIDYDYNRYRLYDLIDELKRAAKRDFISSSMEIPDLHDFTITVQMTLAINAPVDMSEFEF